MHAKAFDFPQKRQYTSTSEEQRRDLEDHAKKRRREETAAAKLRGPKNDESTIVFLTTFVNWYDDGMSRAMRTFNRPESLQKDRDLISSTKEFLLSPQWMPFTSQRDGAYTTRVSMVTEQRFKKSCAEAVEKSIKRAKTETNRAKAKRDRAKAQLDRELRVMRKEAIAMRDDTDFESAAQAEAEAEAFLRGMDVSVCESGLKNADEDDDDDFLSGTNKTGLQEAASAPVPDMNKLAQKYCKIDMRALAAKISEGGVPRTWQEEKTIKLTGLTNKLAACFYPLGDAFFSNIPSRNAAVPHQQARHSFAHSCGKTSKAHGSHVHGQVEAFVNWLCKRKTKADSTRASCLAFLAKLGESLDRCVLRVLSALKERRLYPIGTEVTVIDHCTRTVSMIDLVAYDLAVENEIGVRAVELKTGYGGAGHFFEPAPDDALLAGPASSMRDTPYMRAALQVLFCIIFSAVSYDMHFTGGSVLHVSPNPAEPAVIYGLPGRFDDKKFRTGLYCFFVGTTLATKAARTQSLRTVRPSAASLKQYWRTKHTRRI